MRALLLIPVLLLAACGDSGIPPVTVPDQTNLPPLTPVAPVAPVTPVAPKRAVRFIAFGDAGKGTAMQATVAKAMVDFCKLKECEFALEFGDNFYEAGVTSVTDAQWKTKFEDLYTMKNIATGLDTPVYPTLGNHDNSQSPSGGEGSSNAKGEIQVAYTTAANNTSKRWKLPARYHNFTYPLTLVAGETPVIEFFCLDSNPMAATVADSSTTYNFITYAQAELQWFQGKLAASKAKWTVAFAHHPYVSNGVHGNAGTFEGSPATPVAVNTTNGKPWLDFLNASICDTKYKGGLDIYMFGHDHDFEWLKPVTTCNAKTEFILNGSAADPRAFGSATRNATFFQKDNALSFAWYEVTDTQLRGEVYVLDATSGKFVLDTAGLPKPDFSRTLSKP